MSASTTIKRLGLEKAFQYLYKDPEKNLPKLIDWADKFSKGEFPSQRAAVRASWRSRWRTWRSTTSRRT